MAQRVARLVRRVVQTLPQVRQVHAAGKQAAARPQILRHVIVRGRQGGGFGMRGSIGGEPRPVDGVRRAAQRRVHRDHRRTPVGTL